MTQNAQIEICLFLSVCYVASSCDASLLVLHGVCIIYCDKEAAVCYIVLRRTCSEGGDCLSGLLDLHWQKTRGREQREAASREGRERGRCAGNENFFV